MDQDIRNTNNLPLASSDYESTTTAPVGEDSYTDHSKHLCSHLAHIFSSDLDSMLWRQQATLCVVEEAETLQVCCEGWELLRIESGLSSSGNSWEQNIVEHGAASAHTHTLHSTLAHHSIS
jgi:hypothetical protein